MRGLVIWLRDKLAEQRHASKHDRMRWAFFHYLCAGEDVMRAAGRHLNPSQRAALALKTQKALAIYGWLHQDARARGVPLWGILPKHHAWGHMAFDNAGTNPRKVSCYIDEDIVGRMKRLYIKCHGSTAPRRSLERYVLLQCMHWARAMKSVDPRLEGAEPALKRRRAQ